MTDDEPASITVRDRLTAAGLSGERIEQHMTAARPLPSDRFPSTPRPSSNGSYDATGSAA